MKKIFRMIFRGIRDAFKSVYRNFSLSIASIICITITLFIISSALMVSLNVKYFTKKLEKDVTMVVFLNRDIKKEEVSKIEESIKKISNVQDITYKSKFEIKAEMSKESKEFEVALNGISDADLPLKDSFLVKVEDINKIKDTSDKISAIKGVALVSYGEETVKKMLSAFSFLNDSVFVVVMILVVVTVYLIINTIKLTIYSRKNEIAIMRVVGASNFAIRYPFIVEGIVLGIIGAIIPIIYVVYGYGRIYNKLDGYFLSPLIELLAPRAIYLQVPLVILFISIVVGILGSSGAVRRYLKI